jgi:hypothetical protein
MAGWYINNKKHCHVSTFVSTTSFCLFVYSRLSNFSAILRLSPLPATGLQI